MNKILLAEDDVLLGDSLTTALTQHGWQVMWVQDGNLAETALLTTSFDVLILDWNLPKISGIELLRQLRRKKNTTPALILTARHEVNDKVNALNMGADDYLVKPFALAELNARLQAILRRHIGAADNTITWENITLSLDAHQASVDHQALELSPLEFSLLQLLLQKPGYPVSKQKITDVLYDQRPDISTNAIEAIVSQLRKKIGSERIKTLRGIGYVLASK